MIFFGFGNCKGEQGIYVGQQRYTLNLLKDTNLTNSRPIFTPMEVKPQFTREDETAKEDYFTNPTIYHRLLGRLTYLIVTRLDITYNVNYMSLFMNRPHEEHLDANIRIQKYLKNSLGLGLFFPIDLGTQIHAFTDSDWVACQMTQGSILGFLKALFS